LTPWRFNKSPDLNVLKGATRDVLKKSKHPQMNRGKTSKQRTANMANADSYIDWTGCELVEQVPGKVSGRPIVRGTRILADTIVQDAELGSSLEEIHENYPDLSLTAIQHLISFAQSHRLQPTP
jgi:uncharacterized protein (DUF433 family)